MKRIVKKNQVIIAALTVLLGVAGYLNFSGQSGDKEKDKNGSEQAFAGGEPLDVAAGEITLNDMEDPEHIELNSDEDNIGEAVLTSTGVAVTNMVNIKLSREQSRSKAKANYLEIINDDGMDEMSVASATDAYIKMTEDMEKETEAETILGAKGFSNCIVSIGEESVDVVVCKNELSGEDRAKIEDVVVRKTGCSIDQIVITTVSDTNTK